MQIHSHFRVLRGPVMQRYFIDQKAKWWGWWSVTHRVHELACSTMTKLIVSLFQPFIPQ